MVIEILKGRKSVEPVEEVHLHSLFNREEEMTEYSWIYIYISEKSEDM